MLCFYYWLFCTWKRVHIFFQIFLLWSDLPFWLFSTYCSTCRSLGLGMIFFIRSFLAAQRMHPCSFFTSRLEQKQELDASERQFYSKGKNRMQLDFSSGKLIRKMIEAKIALVKFQNLLANGKTTTNKRTAKMESKLTRFYFKVLSARG